MFLYMPSVTFYPCCFCFRVFQCRFLYSRSNTLIREGLIIFLCIAWPRHMQWFFSVEGARCCSFSYGHRRCVSCSPSQFVFFFQAEDGIRDYKVTGVQTCALPI